MAIELDSIRLPGFLLVRLSAAGFFSNWATVMLTQLVAQSFGLLIGATVMVPKTAQTITSVTMLGMMLVSWTHLREHTLVAPRSARASFSLTV